MNVKWRTGVKLSVIGSEMMEMDSVWTHLSKRHCIMYTFSNSESITTKYYPYKQKKCLRDFLGIRIKFNTKICLNIYL